MKNQKFILAIFILFLAIGFATVSTVLYIRGLANIKGDPNAFQGDVVFEDVKATKGTTVTISNSGRTITFETPLMKELNESSTIKYKIKNYSQYNATFGSPAVSCYYVDAYSDDTTATKTAEINSNDYVSVTSSNVLDGVTLPAGGVAASLSNESELVLKVVKSYEGSQPLELKVQCRINATASDSNVPRSSHVVTSVVTTP